MADAKKTLLVETKVKDLASRDLRKMGKAGKKAGASIAAGFIKAQLAIGAMKVVIRGAVNVIRSLTVDVATQGDEFAKMSRRIGVSIETLSEMKHVAELSGTSFKGLANGLKLLTKNAFDMSTTGGEAAIAFEALGISVTDVRGDLRPVEDLFEDIADRFKDMDNAAEKAALSQKLFGRSGLDLIPILNSGSEGIRAMRQEAQDLGLTFTKAEGILAENFSDAMLRFKRSLDGVVKTIGIELLPVFTELFEEGAKAIVEHRDEIVAWAKTFAEDAGPAIREFAINAKKAIEFVVDAVDTLGKGLATLTLQIRLLSGFLKGGGEEATRVWEDYAKLMDDLPDIVKAATQQVPAPGGGPEDSTRLDDTLVTGKKEVRDFFTEFVDGGKAATEALAGTDSLAKQLGATMTGAATRAVGGFFDAITSGTASASEAFAAMGRDILKTLNRLAAHQLITQIFGAIFGATVPGLTTPVPPPPTALGGIVRSPQVRLVGEAGPEAIVPLSGGGLGGGLSLNFNIIGAEGQSPREIAASVMQTMRDDRNFRKFMRGSTRRGL